MTQWIILWIAAAVLFLLIDMVWLLWLGRSFYVNEIGDLLRRLNRERGVTMVVATHDLHLAARLCDHLVLIRDGRVLAHGTPASTITPDTLRALYGVDADVVHDHATAHVTVVPRTRVH